MSEKKRILKEYLKKEGLPLNKLDKKVKEKHIGMTWKEFLATSSKD